MCATVIRKRIAMKKKQQKSKVRIVIKLLRAATISRIWYNGVISVEKLASCLVKIIFANLCTCIYLMLAMTAVA